MDKNLLQEKIESYLNNTLSGEELAAFEEQLANDKELAKEVFLVKDTNEAIQDMVIEEEYLPQLQELNNKYFKKKSVETVATKKNSSIIIAVVIILGLLAGFFGWQYLTDTEEVDEEAIFAAYYEPYAADELTRGETDATTTYEEAIALYNKSDFVSAIPILEQQITNETNKIPAQILLANCYLSNEPKELQAAIDLLKPLSTDTSHSFTEVAQWYLALAYIEHEKLNLAQPILQEIADKEIGKYPKMAKEVLLKMGK
ncbi:MAG: hypothetical protein AB8G11_10625 [Saprospiraceae bacterium]